MLLGVCADPIQSRSLKEAGFDFVELHVQKHLATLEDETEFNKQLTSIASSLLPCPVANCFVPGGLKITGDEVDVPALQRYVSTALSRAQKAGMDTIVFGSGGARRIPDHFDRQRAWQQLVEFGRMVGPIAQKNDITVVVEPLNEKECNVLTSVGEAGRYVKAVDHPAEQL
ncbi:MAG: TIM barrel protein, partial [Anaerolineae bacterium]|nr:TIM barrel protein [Anaerolineae bacterium]